MGLFGDGLFSVLMMDKSPNTKLERETECTQN